MDLVLSETTNESFNSLSMALITDCVYSSRLFQFNGRAFLLLSVSILGAHSRLEVRKMKKNQFFPADFLKEKEFVRQ